MICAVEEEIYLHDYSLLLRNLRHSSAKTETLKKLREFWDFFYFLSTNIKKSLLLWKRDSSTGVLSWIQQNVWENLFKRTALDDCFFLDNKITDIIWGTW